jgi:hypothetical protein
MRAAAARWLTDLNTLVATWTDDQRARRTICAYVDGLCIQSLVSGDAPDAAEVEAAIRALL